uniref:SCP domain-containing protein n=1 Tax=Chenopodium quinoa TaxID=63459 RepID=A0A803MG42_CHEQI
MCWNSTLAKAANDFVTYYKVNNQCQMPDVWKSNNNKEYGENILSTIGGTVTAVDVWVQDKKSWSYKQVAWPKTSELGCSQALCKEADWSSLTVCFYSPPKPIDIKPKSNCQNANNNVYKMIIQAQ